jgi:hypothetical protein
MLSLLALAALIQEPAKNAPISLRAKFALALLVFVGSALILASALIPTLSPMFGSFVVGVGDVDGDGKPDFVIGDEGWRPTASPAAFWVISGRDAHEIHSFHAQDVSVEFPRHVFPAGDADQDGLADLWLVLEPTAGSTETRIALWSAKTKTITRVATNDQRVPVLARVDGQEPFGDLDGDSVTDKFVVHSANAEIRSGKDTSLLCRIDAAVTEVVLFDDVAADGRPALLCTDPGFGIAQGRVFLCSGRDGRSIWDVMNFDDYWHFGSTISIVGDLDGDGVRDWIVGGCNDRSHENGLAGIHSGKTGVQLATFTRNERGVSVSGQLFRN